MRHLHTLILLTLLIALAGCGKARDKARLDLAQMNITFTDSTFIDNAREGNSDVVKLFLDAGMDIEVRATGGQTALMTAALANKPDVVKLQLEEGADVNAKNKYDGTALMTAAWKGHTEIVQLLLAKNPDLELKDNRGMTALMFAAWENHTDIVRALLVKRAKVDARDVNGWTGLMRAAFKGHTDPVLALIEHECRRKRLLLPRTKRQLQHQRRAASLSAGRPGVTSSAQSARRRIRPGRAAGGSLRFRQRQL